MPSEELIPVTEALLRAGRSAKGGWSSKQLELFGIAWPPTAGWKLIVIGKMIPQSVADQFIAMLGANKPKQQGLFDEFERQEV